MSAPRVLVLEPAARGGLAAHVRMEREVLTEAGVEVIDPHVDIGTRPAPCTDAATVRTLRSWTRPFPEGPGIEAVHAHGLRAGALAALARPTRRYGAAADVRLVVTLHNRIAGGRMSQLLGRLLLSVVTRRADTVLTVSPDLARAARSARHVEHAVVPAETVDPRRMCHACVPDCRGTSTPLQILVVARLAPQKGLDVLLEAVSRLHGDGVDVHVRIAGEGPDEEALRARIDAERLPVELLGQRDDVPELLADTDLVVSAARWEGQPVFLQEALLAGAPIVATDAGGTSLVTGEAAQLVPPGDPGALAVAVARLVDPETRARAQYASRRRAADLPGPPEMLAQLRAVLGLH